MVKSATQKDFDERLESFRSIVIPPRVKGQSGRYFFTFNLWGKDDPYDAGNFVYCQGEPFSTPDWLLIFWNIIQDNPNAKTVQLMYYPRRVFTSAELALVEEIADIDSPIEVFWFLNWLHFWISVEKPL